MHGPIGYSHLAGKDEGDRPGEEPNKDGETAEHLQELSVPRLELPTIADGVDLDSLYELSEILAQQGVR